MEKMVLGSRTTTLNHNCLPISKKGKGELKQEGLGEGIYFVTTREK
jgi:hypothetical protein